MQLKEIERELEDRAPDMINKVYDVCEQAEAGNLTAKAMYEKVLKLIHGTFLKK